MPKHIVSARGEYEPWQVEFVSDEQETHEEGLLLRSDDDYRMVRCNCRQSNDDQGSPTLPGRARQQRPLRARRM